MDDELADLKTLYPNLTPEQLATAKENLDRYLALAWEIFEDMQMAEASTFRNDDPTVGCRERSIPNKPNHLPNS